MTKTTRLQLLAAICVCAVCALFPPRRINTSNFVFVHRPDGGLQPYEATRAFLFSPGFGVYRAPDSAVFRAEVDGGQLLAELMLIGTLTGVVIIATGWSQFKKDENSEGAVESSCT